MYVFSPENHLVIAACSPAPDIAQLLQSLAKIDNWEKACMKLIKKGVAPLFLEIAERHAEVKAKIPAEVMAKLRQAYLKTVSRSMVLYDAFREIAVALNERGIKAVALKGIYLAEHLYPKIGMRQFSDIDLLFCHEDVEQTLKILTDLGFSFANTNLSETITSVFEPAHLRPLLRNGISVEVHTRLQEPLHSYKLNEQAMMERAIATIINGQPFMTLEIHDILIHLCLHLDKHLTSAQLQLYSLADIAYLMQKYGSQLDWALLLQRCQEYQAEHEVIKILQITQELFKFSLPVTLRPKNQTSDATHEHLHRHLNDQAFNIMASHTHLFYIQKIKNPLGKLHYLKEVLLPGRLVMKRVYNLKNDRWYWLWYPYRIWIGLKGLLWKK